MRHPAVLVAPVVTFISVVLMLVVAHFYERLPAQLPNCGFKERLGIPCAACGGTRSMQALSHGKMGTAISFHPLFALSVLATPIWLALGIRNYQGRRALPDTPTQNRLLKRAALIFVALLFLNWIYLIFFLP